MKPDFRSLLAGLTAAMLTFQAQPGMAQTAVKADAPNVSLHGDPGSPDISGLWLGSAMAVPGGLPQTNSTKSADGRPPVHWAPWPLPYKPEFQKMFEERVAATAKGVAIGDIGARCLPFGLPMLLSSKVYPDEIMQIPGATMFLMYGSPPVMIWTDGRPHPADLKPSHNGHSIGRWDGDTLIVDTVGLVGRTPIDTMRNPHSDKLTLRWTLRRVAADVLHLHLTLDDTVAFTEPVAMTNIWHRMTDPKWEILDDGSCFENASGITAKPPEDGFIKF